MDFRVTLDGHLSSASGKLDDAAREAMKIAMGEFFAIDARDPAIDLDFSRDGEVRISCRVQADDLDTAVPPASGVIRTALHAAGIGTPDWPQSDEPAWTVNFISSNAEALTKV